MNIFFIRTFCFILAFSSLLSAQENTATLRILHWNDFHAQNTPFKISKKDSLTGKEISYFVGGTAAFLGYINKYKTEKKNVLLLNAGDEFQGTPISAITNGRSQIDLMNIIRPDAVTLGNHEFDYGLEELGKDIAYAQYPIVCSNVFIASLNESLAEPNKIVQSGNIKIGIIGFTPPDLSILTLKKNITGLALPPIDSLATIYIRELKKQKADIIVLLSHMGIGQDTLLALRRNDIDIIIGGHTHTALFQPIKKNRTIIVQAGSRGQYLGNLDVEVDLNGDSVLQYKGELIETKVDKITPDKIAERKVGEFEEIVNEKLSEVIGTLETDWKRAFGKKESNIGSWECDVMREVCNADISFTNGAGIRKDLPAGPITIRDVWEINPFGNTFVTFTVNGTTLKNMLEWQAEISSRDFMQVGGLRYSFDETKSVGERVLHLDIGGKKVEAEKLYTIATNNYVASHLSDFFGIADSSVTLNDTGILDRDVFIEKIRATKNIHSLLDGRILHQNSEKR